MNEQMQAELTEWVKKGGEFVEREAPLYASEVVSWYFWQGAVGVAFGVALVVLGGLGAWRAYRAISSNDRQSDAEIGLCIGGALLCGSALVIGAIVAPVAACDCIKAKVAPRVVVVESLRSSLK